MFDNAVQPFEVLLNPVRAIYMSSVVFLLGSICGFTSLIWLVVQQRNQDRNRLIVTSTRSLTGGIDVLIQYRPRRTRVGLSARVSLIEPVTAHLLGGVRQERGDRYGAYAVDQPDAAVRGASIETPLKHLRPDPLGVFAGVVYVSADEGDQPSRAMLKLEIWTQAGPIRLAAREVEVRAIHW
jgi:hypothetical protein